jgi:hypothetical protein
MRLIVEGKDVVWVIRQTMQQMHEAMNDVSRVDIVVTVIGSQRKPWSGVSQ